MLKDKIEEIHQKYINFYYNNCKIHFNYIIPIIDFENSSVNSVEISKLNVIFIDGEKHCLECYYESKLKKLKNAILLPKSIEEIENYDIAKLKLELQFMKENYLKLLENIRNNNKQIIIYNENIDYNTKNF